MLDELCKVRFARFRFHLKAQAPLCLPPDEGPQLRFHELSRGTKGRVWIENNIRGREKEQE
jgi:hypothetical protein